MSADARIFVKVQKLTEVWVQVSAVHTGEAMAKAAALPGVVNVLEAQYDDPDSDKPDCAIE